MMGTEDMEEERTGKGLEKDKEGTIKKDGKKKKSNQTLARNSKQWT